MKTTKVFTSDSSHMLDGYDGKCQNLHGHTYKLEITVLVPIVQGGAEDGMVIDLTDLEVIVRQHITDPLNRAFIYHGNNERESQTAVLLEGWNTKTLHLSCCTATENVSVEMYDHLKNAGIRVYNVKLQETPTSCAEYEGG